MQSVDRVDAWMVNRVDYSGRYGSGVFRYLGTGQWRLDTTDKWGSPITVAYRETLRDDWSITLEWKPGTVTRLDTDTKAVRMLSQGGDWQELGTIDVATISTTGGCVSWVDIAAPDGVETHFRRVDDGRWEASRAAGTAPLFVFDQEVSRSDTQISIRESARGVGVVFDLDTMDVIATGGGTELPDGCTITDSGITGPASYEAGEPASVTFENPTSLDLDVLWVDYLGNEIHRHRLRPGDTWSTASFTGHLWMLRDAASRRRIHAGFLTGPTRTTASTNDVWPLGGPAVRTTVKNLYPAPIEVHRVDARRAEVLLMSLAPGEHGGFAGSSGDVLRVRCDGAVIGVLLVGSEPIQYRPVVRGPLRTPDAALVFRNKSPLSIALSLAHDGTDIVLHHMDPGEVVSQPAVSGETWSAREADSGRLLATVVAPPEDDEVILTSLVLRPPRTPLAGSDDTVTRRFVNTAPAAGMPVGLLLNAIVYRVDEFGHELDGHPVAPGQSYEVDTRRGDVWRVREETSGSEIAVHVVERGGFQEVPVRVRSTHSRVPVRLSIQNRTLLTAEVLWVDGDGSAHSQGVLAPWGTIQYDTFATHTWLLRERESGVVLDVLVAHLDDHTLVLDSTDLVRLRGAETTSLDLHNRLGFPCEVIDLADPLGANLTELRPDEEKTLQVAQGVAIGVREPGSGGIFAARVCVGASPGFPLELRGDTSGVATQVAVFNDSTLETTLYRWQDGHESEVAQIGARQSVVLDTVSGSVWLVRETPTGVVLACTMATGAPRRIRVDGRYHQAPGAARVDLALTNRSGAAVEVRSVAADGTETGRGSLADGASRTISSFVAQTTRFLLPGTELELDRCITGEEAPFPFVVRNNLLSESIDGGGLRPGEVALFERPQFQGGVKVAHCDIGDLGAAGVAAVRSLTLGPGTGIVARRAGGPAGSEAIDDVFYLDTASLVGTDVGEHIGGFEIFTVAQSADHSLDITTALTNVTRRAADRSSTVETTAYRTVVRFPPSVRAVEVWATEDVTAYVGDTAHQLNATRPTQLAPTSAGTLSLAIEAKTIGTASLLLRTNVMDPGSRFFVYPDGEAMRTLRDQPDDFLSSRAEELGLQASALGADDAARARASAQVMTSLRQLASAAPGTGPDDGRLRGPGALDMDYDAWSLDRRGAISFAPLSPQQAHALPTGESSTLSLLSLFADFDRLIVRPVAASTQQILTTVDRVGRDAAMTADQALRALDENIIAPILETVDDVIVAPVLAAAADGVEAIGQLVDGVGHLLATEAAKAAQTLQNVTDIVLAVTAEKAGAFELLILDTADKVASVVTAVFKEIGAAVDSVVTALASLFDWDAIRATHDRLLHDVAEQFFTGSGAWLDALSARVDTGLDGIASAVRSGLAGVGDSLGAIPPPARGSRAQSATSAPPPDWILDRLFGELDDGTVSATPFPQAPDLKEVATGMASVATQLESALTDLVELVLAGVEGAASSPPEELGRRVVGLLLGCVEQVATEVITLLKIVAGLVITLVRQSIAFLRAVLLGPLEIPVLSELYCQGMKRDTMTPLGLASLLVAVPASVAGRAIAGDDWPPNESLCSLGGQDALRAGLGIGSYTAGILVAPVKLIAPDPDPAKPLLMALDCSLTLLAFPAELPTTQPPPLSVENLLGSAADVVAGIVLACNLGQYVATCIEPRTTSRHASRRLRRSSTSRALNTFSATAGLLGGFVGLASDIDAQIREPSTASAANSVHGLSTLVLAAGGFIGAVSDTGRNRVADDRTLVAEALLAVAGSGAAAATLAIGALGT